MYRHFALVAQGVNTKTRLNLEYGLPIVHLGPLVKVGQIKASTEINGLHYSG
jgi:hypothetical protein